MKKLRNLFKKRISGRSPLRVAFIIVVVLSLLAGIVALVSGITYTNGGRSLFGSKDTYEQSQTLRYDNLDLRVKKVEVTAFTNFTDKPDTIDCNQLSPTPTVGRFSPQFWCLNGLAYDESVYEKTLADEKAHAAAYDKLIVYVAYANVADTSLDMSKYKVTLVANDPVVKTDAAPRASCQGIVRLPIISGSEQSGCLTSDVTKGYDGPLRLIVKKDGKEKSIKLSIPKTQ